MQIRLSFSKERIKGRSFLGEKKAKLRANTKHYGSRKKTKTKESHPLRSACFTTLPKRF
jgi:hypothetical protein